MCVRQFTGGHHHWGSGIISECKVWINVTCYKSKFLCILGNEIPSQVVPVPDVVLQIPGRDATTTQELVFTVPTLASLGVQSFYVEDTSSSSRKKRFSGDWKRWRRSPQAKWNKAGDTVIDNGVSRPTINCNLNWWKQSLIIFDLKIKLGINL